MNRSLINNLGYTDVKVEASCILRANSINVEASSNDQRPPVVARDNTGLFLQIPLRGLRTCIEARTFSSDILALLPPSTSAVVYAGLCIARLGVTTSENYFPFETQRYFEATERSSEVESHPNQ